MNSRLKAEVLVLAELHEPGLPAGSQRLVRKEHLLMVAAITYCPAAGSRPLFIDSFTQTLPSAGLSTTSKLSQLQAERRMVLQRLKQLDAAIRELPH